MWFIILTIVLISVNNSFLQETSECKCVTYYLCNATTGTVIQDGDGLFDERLGNCICNCGSGEVCCRLPGVSPPEKNLCGVHNIDGIGYKSGGNGAGGQLNLGEFPWFIDIMVVETGALRCGGTLIHPSVVLTSAHCVTRKKTYVARAGDWDTSGTYEILQHQDLVVASKQIHEDYNPAVYHNDIALLFLNGSFNLESHIQIACLPPPEVRIGDGTCYVIGRGKDEAGQYNNIPKKTDISLVGKTDCQNALRKTKLGQSWYLHSSMQCAGGEKGKDACLGDGGGPLVCPISGKEARYQQVGIVSWGIGCFQANVPAVYTNVPVLRKWIDKQMKAKNLETTQYVY